MVWSAWVPPSSFFPHTREGAERRKALGNIWHLGRCRVPFDRHARLPALHSGDFCRDHRASSSGPEGLPLTLSRQHWRCPSSDRVQPSKAGPSSGPDGNRASWDESESLACRRRHPRSATERLRKAPLGERGRCAPYVKREGCQIWTLRLQGPSTVPTEG